MKTTLLSALTAAVTLATAACSPAMIQPDPVTITDSPAAARAPDTAVEKLTWGTPLSASQHPADAYVASNMLITRGRRMALPEGWHFKRRQKGDPDGVALWIHDSGGNAVSGAYFFTHFDFPISPLRATGVYADKVMSGFRNKQAHRTEIDGSEAHVVTGVSTEGGPQRISTLIFGGSSSVRAINDITLLVDPGYLSQNPGVPHAIANSFSVVPGRLAERRIKGSFSFRCHDGTLDWLDDITRKWQSAGFSVIGKAGDNGVIIDISQVSTARFQDFFKLDRFQPGELQTELRFAGKAFPARAIVSESSEEKTAHMVFLFEHGGKDYLLDIFAKLHGDAAPDGKSLHKDKDIRRILDQSFYFDG